MKQRKPFDQYTKEEIDVYRKTFVTATLRRASYRWPWRSIAAAKARIDRGIYVCGSCGKSVRNKDKRIDHIEPFIDPIKGFTGWDDAILRLLCAAEGLQVLCEQCHSYKTKAENEQRKAERARKRGENKGRG